MRRSGKLRRVPLDRLRLAGDFPQRLRAGHVQELAESIRLRSGGEPLHPPIVSADYRVVTGNDRIAALKLLGADDVLVEVLDDGVPQVDLDILTVEENLRRRPGDRNKLLAEYSRLTSRRDAELREAAEEKAAAMGLEKERAALLASPVEAPVTQEDLNSAQVGPNSGPTASLPPKKKPGRKPVKAEAREKTARAFGTTAKAVKHAEQRAAAKEKAKEKAKEAPPAPPVTPPSVELETWGLEVPPEVMTTAAKRAERVQYVVKLLRAARAIAKEIGHDQAAAIKSAAHRVQISLPVAVCANCKLTRLQKDCPHCRGLGWMTDEQLALVPAELRAVGKLAMVRANGRIVPRERYVGPDRGHLRVVAYDETGAPPPSDDDYAEPSHG